MARKHEVARAEYLSDRVFLAGLYKRFYIGGQVALSSILSPRVGWSKPSLAA